MELIENKYFQSNCDKLIIERKHLNPEFFNLKTGFIGEILQKFTMYNLKTGIVGDFSAINSKSLKDFIYESNKNRKIILQKQLKKR